MTARHAQSPLHPEYTLCGLAYDSDAMGEERPVFAKAGERVNCPHCRVVVNYCDGFDRAYRQPPLIDEPAAQRASV